MSTTMKQVVQYLAEQQKKIHGANLVSAQAMWDAKFKCYFVKVVIKENHEQD